MNALDELSATVLTLLRAGEPTCTPPALAGIETVHESAVNGGCLQDLVDLHAWRPRSMHDWLT
jgi:hypothetical protein